MRREMERGWKKGENRLREEIKLRQKNETKRQDRVRRNKDKQRWRRRDIMKR